MIAVKLRDELSRGLLTNIQWPDLGRGYGELCYNWSFENSFGVAAEWSGLETEKIKLSRQSSEHALHEQREWFRVTLSSIGDAVITTDTNSGVTFMNPVAECLTGWKQEEVSGKPLDLVFRIINEETRHTIENPATRALREGIVIGLENHTLLIARDGTERPIDNSAAPIRNANDEVSGVVLVFRDVSERRRQEVSVQSSEVRYRRLFESARDGILILDAISSKIVDSNPFMTELLGYSHDDFLGKELWEIGLFKDEQASRANFRELEEKGYIRYENLPLRSVTGKEVEVEFVSNIYLAGDHDVIQCNIRDISERRSLERELKDHESRFRTLVEQVKDYAIFMTDPQRRATSWNEGVQQIFGFGEDEWIGRDIVPLIFTPEAIEKGLAQKEFIDAEANGRAGDDRWMLKKDGDRFFALGILTALRDEQGGLLGFTKVVRDQTERKRLEDDLKLRAEQLGDLHRRKDEFLAMLGHELRNPLAPISNAVQLLHMHKDEDQILHQARTIIERQVGQMSRLVDDLLEVTRITSGRVQVRPELLQVGNIVERAVESASPLMDQRRHEFTVSLSPDPIWLNADPTRMEQIVVNLLINAAKYTENGGHVWLSAQQDGDECVLKVRDTGVGILPELLPRIFDLFTQGERSLDRSEGGLGIGLALVQKLVELHHGRVEAHSSLGKGSEFIVRLPVATIPGPTFSTAKELAVSPQLSLRVLVVDDNVDAADSLATLLITSGHAVRTAYAGPTALEVTDDHHPDVILLDIGLPGFSGYEVAKRLRQQPNFSNVVLIAMTGYGQESDRSRSIESGFDHHLVKPVPYEQVLQILATVGTTKQGGPRLLGLTAEGQLG